METVPGAKYLAATTMSLEAALSLSVPELLRVLNEKLGLECTRAREIRLPPVPASITSLGTEVSGSQSTSLGKCGTGGGT